jgi:hypothetical protein
VAFLIQLLKKESLSPGLFFSLYFSLIIMARRWSIKEEEGLAVIKKRLKDELAARQQFPEGAK